MPPRLIISIPQKAAIGSSLRACAILRSDILVGKGFAMQTSDLTAYDALGGAETLRKLVDAFYERVAADADLRPLFPDDFSEIREKQYEFLTQFFGGPPLYAQRNGHPMLRRRHIRFTITPRHAAAWLSCMEDALDAVSITGPVREFMLDRLARTAQHMVNVHDGVPDADRSGFIDLSEQGSK